MNWRGDNTWFFGLVGQRAIGFLIQYLYNFLYSFFRYIYAQFQKRQQDLNLLQRFSIPIQLFTEDWIVDWAVLAQIVEYSMHPISLKILFYANRSFKWIVLWCLFLLSNFFFFQKSLCWERKWWGELKIRTWQTLLLSNFPRIANSLCPALNMAMNLLWDDLPT